MTDKDPHTEGPGQSRKTGKADVSMAQIAKLAGVSTATVSRVLAGSPLVREETAEQVRQIIKQVGYVLPQTPRTRRRRSASRGATDMAGRSIAIITLGQIYHDWLTVPTISMFVAGVTSVAREAEISVLLDEMPDPMEPCRLVRRGEVAGAILLVDSEVARSPEGARSMHMLAERLPVVWAMGGHIGAAPVDHVAPDNLGIGHTAAQYLLGKGCKRAAFVTTEPHWPLTQLRAMAFVNTCENAGLEVTTYLVSNDAKVARTYAGDAHVMSSLNDVASVMARPGDRADGVFIPRDYETARFYPLLEEAGLKPQRDVTIVSCDNDIRQLSTMDPHPATIDLNTREVAKRAIRCLRQRIRNSAEPPVLVHVSPKLIEPNDQATVE